MFNENIICVEYTWCKPDKIHIVWDKTKPSFCMAKRSGAILRLRSLPPSQQQSWTGFNALISTSFVASSSNISLRKCIHNNPILESFLSFFIHRKMYSVRVLKKVVWPAINMTSRTSIKIVFYLHSLDALIISQLESLFAIMKLNNVYPVKVHLLVMLRSLVK